MNFNASCMDLTLGDIAKLSPDARTEYENEMAKHGISLHVKHDGSVMVRGVRPGRAQVVVQR